MRAATDTLRDVRGGELVEELSEEIARVVNAVVATGKKGHLTLKLSVSPASKGDCAVTVVDEIKSTIPQLAKPETLMFATPEGSLTRQDPRQKNLSLEAVTTTATTTPLQAVA